MSTPRIEGMLDIIKYKLKDVKSISKHPKKIILPRYCYEEAVEYIKYHQSLTNNNGLRIFGIPAVLTMSYVPSWMQDEIQLICEEDTDNFALLKWVNKRNQSSYK